MQQNFRQVTGGTVIWDTNSQYQICNVYGQSGVFLYQYIPQVTNGGDLYYANGSATPTIGLSPASDTAWTALTGGAASMLPLPQGQIYVGNASNQPQAMEALYFVNGGSSPQINYDINLLSNTIEFDIWDDTNFTNLDDTVIIASYTIPTLPSGIILDNIIGFSANLQTTQLNSITTGSVSTWASALPTSTSIQVAALNTTGTPITDGVIWTRVKYKLQ